MFLYTGKREAEDAIGKQVPAKKQKKDAAVKQSTDKLKAEVKTQKKTKKKQETSSSEESSDSEEEKKV